MAAPTLQAEGTQNQVTTGNLTLTLPAHQTDDILVCTLAVWLPSTAGSLAVIPDLADWTKAAFVQFPGTPDGEIALFWRRATASGTTNPAFTRGASWDTGTDGIYAGRAYVIRGCITTGTPWDELDPTVALTAANGSCDAVTVSGIMRTVIQFHAKTDDFSTAPTISGWTPGTASEDTTGTDSSFRTFRKENLSSSTTADASTVEAPVAGAYLFFGASFIPSNTDLTVADATQAQTVDNIALVVDLVVQDATQGQTADNVVLEEVVPPIDLTVQDATQVQTADNLSLTQVHVLAVADATQAQTADNLALTQVHELVVQDATEGQTVDNIDLTQVHVLAVADATQAHTVDNVVLDAGASTDLVVQDASQAQTADSLTLTQVHNLTAQDAAQSQTVDNLALTQTHLLLVADATQAQTADTLTLTQVHELAVADALHAQTVDNIDIDATGAIPLTVQDARHTQTAGNLKLNTHLVPPPLTSTRAAATFHAGGTTGTTLVPGARPRVTQRSNAA